MQLKRKQITVKQYHLNKITYENGNLVITEDGIEIEHFYNFFIKNIENILNESIPKDIYFILKFDEIKDEEDDKLKDYEKALRDGIWLKGTRYIKSVKSPSMVRQQKTLFIREDVAKKVMEYVALGRIPTHTVVSKLESAYGISLSSILMVPEVPRIVFIKDMKKIITEDVEVIRECETDPIEVEKVKEQIDKEKALKKAWKENRPTDEELRQLPRYTASSFAMYKSKNAWYKENRRVIAEQIVTPVGHGERNGDAHPIYSENQTELIEFPRCSSETIGKKVEYIENHEVTLCMFDGQALGSFDWFSRVGKQLGLSYVTNGIQGRLPYFKGLIVRFDIHKWCRDNNVTEIIDLFGVKHQVSNIDIIATESCWKTFHDYSSGKKQCLFNSGDDWYEQMEKYGVTEFGIANFAKAERFMKEFTPLNYQFIYALPKLTVGDLKELSKPYEKLLYKVKESKDIAYIKAFLQMMDSESEENNYFSDKCLEMISIDERLIHDKKIQKFLVERVNDELDNLKRGRIPIRGGYRYLTQDVIAFMEWATYQDIAKVKGFLYEPYSVYKQGEVGEHVLMRNPTTSPKEVVRAMFVESDDEYVKHLDTIIVTSVNDLLLPSMTADVDGDLALFSRESAILSGMHDNVPLIHDEDKQFSTTDKAEYTENNLDEIINYEKRNTSSMIGILTNWNTKFQDLALSLGDYRRGDLVVSVNKIYQMQLIDAAKTGEIVEIAFPIEMHGRKMKKPYFMYWIYGGDRDGFNGDIKSSLNQYVLWIEREAEKIEKASLKTIDIEYYQSITSTMELFQYRKGLPYYSYLDEVIEKLKPVYSEYAKEKQKVNFENEKFKELPKIKQESAVRDRIRAKYADIKHRYRILCYKVEPNASILATAAVELAYRLKKERYSFAWDVAYEGMKWNALQNRLNSKTRLDDLGYINTKEPITGVATVEEGKIKIKQVEIGVRDTRWLENPLVVDVDLPDGKYSVLSVMDRHYAISEVENKHDEFMCHRWYEKQNEKAINPILKKNIRFLTRGKIASEVIELLFDKEFTLRTVADKGYANVYDGDEWICSVDPKKVIQYKVSMGMNEWKVKFHSLVTEWGKSFLANVSITEDGER